MAMVKARLTLKAVISKKDSGFMMVVISWWIREMRDSYEMRLRDSYKINV